MRQALWITRFDWNDRHDLAAIVERALDAGITDLIMQARGAGDALYRSDIAPASPKIASRLGGRPDWDPLDHVCSVADARGGVRVHAWINVLTGWSATSPEACKGLVPSESGTPDHVLLRHPAVVLVDANGRPMPCPNDADYVWVSPGHAAVIAELEAVTSELVARYPLAGVHLDRIRYPGGTWVDPTDRSRRADAVTELVRSIRARVVPPLEVTASLVPDYGSPGSGAPEHLAEYAQDGWRWVEDGLVDSIMPMVYTPIAEGASDDWLRLVWEHRSGVGAERCWTPVFAGLDAHMMSRQATQARQWPTTGIAWYSAGLIERHARWDLIRDLTAAR